MRITARLERVEADLTEALLWEGVQEVAAETGLNAAELVKEAREIANRYLHLAVPMGGGKADIEPALRAMADGEGVEYEELLRAARRTPRRQV